MNVRKLSIVSEKWHRVEIGEYWGHHSPPKSVCHHSDAEGAHHAAHTKDGHRQAPHNGARSWFDGLGIPLHPCVIEEGPQFLSRKRERQRDREIEKK